MKSNFFIVLFFLFFLLPVELFASRQPYLPGSSPSAAFANSEVSIEEAKIKIIPALDFKEAQFEVDYKLKVQEAGLQIPLLFFIDPNFKDYKVFLDGKEVSVKKVTKEYYDKNIKHFQNFSHYWEMPQFDQRHLFNLYYFDALLSKGSHGVRVEYGAKVGADLTGWQKKYYLQFNLNPASKYQSFEKLKIQIDHQNLAQDLQTNLGAYVDRSAHLSTWEFVKIPNEALILQFKAQPSPAAKALIWINPLGASLLLMVLFWVGVLSFLKAWAKGHAIGYFSGVVLLSLVLIPLVGTLAYFGTESLILFLLADKAGVGNSPFFFGLLALPSIAVLTILFWISLFILVKKLKQKA